MACWAERIGMLRITILLVFLAYVILRQLYREAMGQYQEIFVLLSTIKKRTHEKSS